jgi:antitoxin component YwqK of YwqJK toxin-antitoxin module/tetratricopeptide (TPR) repeat protein
MPANLLLLSAMPVPIAHRTRPSHWLPFALSFVALLSSDAASAQDALARDHGYHQWIKGQELESQDKNAEAEQVYATINRNDSVFERALFRRVITLSRQKKYAEEIPLCDQGIALDGDLAVPYHMQKAAALLGLKRHDEAIACFDTAIQRYPGRFHLYHLRALVLEEKGDMAGCFAAFKENAVRFPMQQEAHMSLASLAEQEGRTAQAALSYYMALIMSWGNARSTDALVQADQVLSGKADTDSKGLDLTRGDDFAELDLLLANQVAMNKKYKVEPDLSFPFVRQGHFLLTSLKDHPQGDGFWTTYYVPFFKRLLADGHFEAFVYHALGASTDEKIKGLSVKYARDVQKFREAMFPLITELYAVFPDTIGGVRKPLYHQWNTDNDLMSVGEGDANKDQETGPWVFFHENGAVSARGTFSEDHTKQGLWTYYHENGRPKFTKVWASDKENGLFRSWHPNGAPADSVNLVEGIPQGLFTAKAPFGHTYSRRTFVDGNATGPATYYLGNDALDYTCALKAGELEGDITRHYADGVKSFEATFKAGKRGGVAKAYHHNGTTKSAYTYVDNTAEGPFTEWYSNGQKSNEGTFKEGHMVGAHTEWSMNGNLRSEEHYDDQGRNEGVSRLYTPEGQVIAEMEYNRGLLMRYRYFDRTGKKLSEAARAKGKFQFQGSYPDGSKRMQGVYLDEGAKDGLWTWYWPDGSLNEEENMDKGKLEGVQRAYHRNGKVSVEYRYLAGKENTGPYTQYRLDGSRQLDAYVEAGTLNGELRRSLANGTVNQREYYVDGERDGWQAYYDSDGVLSVEQRWEAGVLRETVHYDAKGKAYERFLLPPGAFVMRSKYPDGHDHGEVHYMNGVRHGLSKWLYPDGSKSLEGNYVNGEEDGVWKSWHPNGTPSWEATYDLGERTGTVKRWYINGQLESEETFTDDLSTNYKNWHLNGKMAIERERRLGEEHGAARSYSYEGELQVVRYYENDRMVGYAYNGADGKLMDTIPLGDGVAQLRPKYANGKPSRDMDYRNGELHGVYKEYHPNGQLMEEATFEVGSTMGETKEFYPDGRPWVTGTARNGDRHGTWTTYWENGQPMEKSQWADNDLHGERILYDRAGKPTLILMYRNDEVISMRKP